MVGLSASWNVSGPQSGRAVISSDWLTEMKSFPAFLVCSLIAICTCAARPPTMNSHLSFSISSLVRWAPTAGLSWSSRNRISSLRPRIPPLALISSIATIAPCCWSLARAPKGPVVGPGKPTLIVSPPCALRIAGKAATAAPAAVVARNARRFIGRLLGESGADHRGGPLACQTQPGQRSRVAPDGATSRLQHATHGVLRLRGPRSSERRASRARLPRVRHVGSRAKRPDDPRILTGRGRYVDDLLLPRMVHVAFVRSVHAHARLGRVGVGAARRAPDVETPAPSIAGGYKGAGEGGTAGASAAILNAVNDALAPFGAMVTDQPVTPERVLRAAAFLPLIDPRRYGVLDIRAWQLLFGLGAVERKPAGRGFAPRDWLDYLAELRRHARRRGVPTRAVEYTLFQCHRRFQKGRLYR